MELRHSGRELLSGSGDCVSLTFDLQRDVFTYRAVPSVEFAPLRF